MANIIRFTLLLAGATMTRPKPIEEQSDVHPTAEASLRLRRAGASDLRSDAEDAPWQAPPRLRGQGERADSRYAGGERIARSRGQVGGRMAHPPYDRRGHLQQRRAGLEPRLLLEIAPASR